MYAYDYKASVRSSSILLPALKFNDVVWWVDPAGNTHTGQIKSVELVDQTWWASARYEQLPGVFITEHRRAFEFFLGTAPDFPVQVQLNQKVWFDRGGLWQSGIAKGLSLICDKWYVDCGIQKWFGLDFIILPLTAIRTSAPDPLAQDQEYGLWLDTLVSA